jgi:hypothetical protein
VYDQWYDDDYLHVMADFIAERMNDHSFRTIGRLRTYLHANTISGELAGRAATAIHDEFPMMFMEEE